MILLVNFNYMNVGTGYAQGCNMLGFTKLQSIKELSA